MAKTTPDTIRENIEIVDLPEELTEGKGFNAWLLIPVLLAAAVGIFFVLSRFLNKDEE